MFEICKDCVWRYRCPESDDVNRDEEGCDQKRVHGQKEKRWKNKPLSAEQLHRIYRGSASSTEEAI